METIKGFIAIISLTVMFAVAAAAQTVLTTLDGGRVDLDGQKGKVVVLAVGAAWLPLSAKQAEYTNALAKKYAGKDVVFYFVATDSSNVKSKNFMSPEDIRKFAGTNKIGVTVLRDSDGAITLKKYDIDQVPSFVILNKNGVRVGEPFGGISTDPKFDLTIPISKAIDKIL
ncbi:MAG TPA: TlpA disulfide reductase family protein [Pyrinomonadaceae bacterium]|nr:TlpA disulfide reductase family protein [Pyrinomonadaceae bacterium]